MVQVGLHGAVGQGVLPQLVIAAEPTGEFTFGAVRQMGDLRAIPMPVSGAMPEA